MTDDRPYPEAAVETVRSTLEATAGTPEGDGATAVAILAALEAGGWLQSDLDAMRKVLIFADGLAVSSCGMALADLYAEDYEPAQKVLRDAGCHARGALKAKGAGWWASA